MEDYIEEIKRLLLEFYAPEGKKSLLTHRTTRDVLREMQGVIPMYPITEHDVYSVLKELNFMQSQVIHYERVCIFEGDEEQGIPPEYEKQEVARTFAWEFYPIIDK